MDRINRKNDSIALSFAQFNLVKNIDVVIRYFDFTFSVMVSVIYCIIINKFVKMCAYQCHICYSMYISSA